MGMEVNINIETVKSQIKLIKDPVGLQSEYNTLLDVIRDLEFIREQPGVDEKIIILEGILDMLGCMILTAAKDC